MKNWFILLNYWELHMKNWWKVCLVCCLFILTSWSFVACTNTANASDEGDKDSNGDVSTESPLIPEKPETTPAHQHNYGAWYVTLPATCTQNGTERRDCTDTVCEFYETRIVKALGHHYQTSTNPANCTEPGTITYTCTCGDTYQEEIPATGHTHDEIIEIVEPTCTQGGYTLKRCHCGDEIITDEKPANGHVYETVATEEVTCTQDGSITKRCHCGDEITTTTEKATGHDYNEATHRCEKCNAYQPPIENLVGSYWYITGNSIWAIYINSDSTYISYKGTVDENGNFIKDTTKTSNYKGSYTVTKITNQETGITDYTVTFTDEYLKKDNSVELKVFKLSFASEENPQSFTLSGDFKRLNNYTTFKFGGYEVL